MKRTPKAAFFIVAVLILALSVTSLFGVYTQYGDRTDTIIRGVADIRWGIDIQGGVDVVFGPTDENVNPTNDQLDAVKTIIEQRLISKNITDYEAYTAPANNQVIVRFPWATTTETPEDAVAEIGQTAMLEFHIGSATDADGKPTGKLVLNGNDVKSAKADYQPVDESNSSYQYVVALELNDSGKKAFSDATKEQAGKGTISIWLDDQMISNPSVNNHIADGRAVITGSATFEEAKALADLITSGALPFEIEAKSLGSTSPTMGANALSAKGIAAIFAMILVCVMMGII